MVCHRPHILALLHHVGHDYPLHRPSAVDLEVLPGSQVGDWSANLDRPVLLVSGHDFNGAGLDLRQQDLPASRVIARYVLAYDGRDLPD